MLLHAEAALLHAEAALLQLEAKQPQRTMNTETKTYVHWGYLITRRYHYVDAHQHYDYITNVTGHDVTFSSLAKAKKYISDALHGRK